jgi:hypothetical protein
MTGSDKIVLAILTATGVLVAGGAFVYVKTAKAALPPGAASTNVARGGKVTWEPTNVVRQGDRIRISVDPADYAQLATSLGGVSTGMWGWQSLLANPTIQHVINAPSMSAWAPSDPLPTDWPAGDATAATEYHAEFVYGGVLPLNLAQSPLPMRAWVATAVS